MSTEQADWHRCVSCNTLFFNGSADKGACPASGKAHQPDRLDFVLKHDVPAGVREQSAWRFCHKCAAMFYDGFSTKGKCDRDLAGHEAAGDVFVLPYDGRQGPTVQTQWGFCNKCGCMVYDGDADKGHCAAGDVHVTEGFVFALPHLDPAGVTVDTS